jgi:hypothetical protein
MPEFKIVYRIDTVTGRYVIDVPDDGMTDEASALMCDRALKIMQSHFQHEKPTRRGVN